MSEPFRYLPVGTNTSIEKKRSVPHAVARLGVRKLWGIFTAPMRAALESEAFGTVLLGSGGFLMEWSAIKYMSTNGVSVLLCAAAAYGCLVAGFACARPMIWSLQTLKSWAQLWKERIAEEIDYERRR